MKVCHLVLSEFLIAGTIQVSIAEEQVYPPAGKTIVYKGVTLVGTTYKFRNSDKFFRYMKAGIDMVGKLPDADWNHTGLIKKVVYDPPSKERKSTAALPGRLAYYWTEDGKESPAPVYYFGSVRNTSGFLMALMMVEQGRVAFHHKQLLETQKLLQDMDSGEVPFDSGKFREAAAENLRLKNLFQAEPGSTLLMADECMSAAAMYKAHEILYPDKEKLSAFRKLTRSTGCP